MSRGSPPPDMTDDGVDEASRRALCQVFDEVAAATTLRPDAWDDFQARRRELSPSRRPDPRVLLGVAAALLALLVVAGSLLPDGGDGKVDITDETSTTVERPDRSTTSSTAPSSTSTTTDGGPVDGGQDAPPGPVGTVPPGPGAGQGTGPEPSPDAPGSRPEGPAPAAPAPRATPVASLEASGGDYTVELIWQGGTMYFRRTDDVGSTVPGPDAYRHREGASWGPIGAPTCVASSGQNYRFPNAGDHAFTWGVVGSEIATVEVVMTDGARRSARIGAPLGDGLRPWILERPLGTVERIEGRNAEGVLVASITDLIADWGLAGC